MLLPLAAIRGLITSMRRSAQTTVTRSPRFRKTPCTSRLHHGVANDSASDHAITGSMRLGLRCGECETPRRFRARNREVRLIDTDFSGTIWCGFQCDYWLRCGFVSVPYQRTDRNLNCRLQAIAASSVGDLQWRPYKGAQIIVSFTAQKSAGSRPQSALPEYQCPSPAVHPAGICTRESPGPASP